MKKKMKLEVIMPKPTLRAVKEIIRRLEERNPSVCKDLPPANLTAVVMKMWYYGYHTKCRMVAV